MDVSTDASKEKKKKKQGNFGSRFSSLQIRYDDINLPLPEGTTGHPRGNLCTLTFGQNNTGEGGGREARRGMRRELRIVVAGIIGHAARSIIPSIINSTDIALRGNQFPPRYLLRFHKVTDRSSFQLYRSIVNDESWRYAPFFVFVGEASTRRRATMKAPFLIFRCFNIKL